LTFPLCRQDVGFVNQLAVDNANQVFWPVLEDSSVDTIMSFALP
jgi:hypothetical protein